MTDNDAAAARAATPAGDDMATVTTEQKGSDHTYILIDGKWVATTFPQYAEVVRAAIEAQVSKAPND